MSIKRKSGKLKSLPQQGKVAKPQVLTDEVLFRQGVLLIHRKRSPFSHRRRLPFCRIFLTQEKAVSFRQPPFVKKQFLESSVNTGEPSPCVLSPLRRQENRPLSSMSSLFIPLCSLNIANHYLIGIRIFAISYT